GPHHFYTLQWKCTWQRPPGRSLDSLQFGSHTMTCLQTRHLLRLSCLGFVFALTRGAAIARATETLRAAPQFGRHVVAVLDRLGCNAGACHGSFRGQNGFRLSLFGGDASMDFEYIVRDAFGRRINRADPEKSLLLLKPTLQLPHQGGLRLAKDGPE